MENARYTGGCACGQMKYDITGESVRMLNCHCRDCQRASGSAYAALLAFEQKSVKLTGELRYYGVTSEWGNRLERGFCPNCGNPVTIKPGARQNLAVCAGGQPGRSVIAQADGADLGPERAALGLHRSARPALRHAAAAVGGSWAAVPHHAHTLPQHLSKRTLRRRG